MNQTALYLLLLFGAISSSAAQEYWQITLSSGDTLAHVGLLQVTGDSLEVTSHGTNSWVNVASVSEVRSVSDVQVWETAKEGALYTGIVAGVVAAVAIAINAHSSPTYSFDPGNTTVKVFGAILGAAFYGATFGLLGGTVAGIVALVQNQDEVYDLSHARLKEKEYTLQAIINEQ